MRSSFDRQPRPVPFLRFMAALGWIVMLTPASGVAGEGAGSRASEAPALAGCRGFVAVDEGVSLTDLDEAMWTRAGSGMWWVTPGAYTIDARYVGQMGRIHARDKDVILAIVPRRHYVVHPDVENRPFIVEDVTEGAWELERNPKTDALLPAAERGEPVRVHVFRREQQSGRAYFFCDAIPLAWSIDRGQTAFSLLLTAGPHCFALGSKSELKEGQCQKDGLRLDLAAGQEVFLELDTKKSKVLRVDDAAGLEELRRSVYLALDRVHPAFRWPDPCNPGIR